MSKTLSIIAVIVLAGSVASQIYMMTLLNKAVLINVDTRTGTALNAFLNNACKGHLGQINFKSATSTVGYVECEQ